MSKIATCIAKSINREPLCEDNPRLRFQERLHQCLSEGRPERSTKEISQAGESFTSESSLSRATRQLMTRAARMAGKASKLFQKQSQKNTCLAMETLFYGSLGTMFPLTLPVLISPAATPPATSTKMCRHGQGPREIYDRWVEGAANLMMEHGGVEGGLKLADALAY